MTSGPAFLYDDYFSLVAKWLLKRASRSKVTAASHVTYARPGEALAQGGAIAIATDTAVSQGQALSIMRGPIDCDYNFRC